MIVFGVRGGVGTTIRYYDAYWADAVDSHMNRGYSFNKAAECVSEAYCFDEDTYYYFLNPLVPNFIDDEHADKIYYVDAITGALTKFSDNAKLMFKLNRGMGFGEALCDSVEVLP